MPEKYSLTPLGCIDNSLPTAVQYGPGAEAARPRKETVTPPVHPEVGKDPSLRGGTVTSSKGSSKKTWSCSQDAKYSGTTAENVKSKPEMAFIQKYPQLIYFVDHCIPNSSCLRCLISHPSVLYFKASVKPEKNHLLAGDERVQDGYQKHLILKFSLRLLFFF